MQFCNSRSRQGSYLLCSFGGRIPRAVSVTLNRPLLLPALWPRPRCGQAPPPSRALRPIKKFRPGRCTPPRASVRRPRLAKESAAILFFSWFQWGERRKQGAGRLGGPAAAAATAAATTASVLVAWERRRESRARAAGGAAAGESAVGRRWRI